MRFIYAALLAIYCLLSFDSYAIRYYVSPFGNDANSGTSTSNAWKTIGKVNSRNFKGDTILFEGGSTFYGKLSFTNTDIGTESKPIVIGSYGTGRATINSDTLNGISIYNAAGFEIKDLILTGVNRLTNKGSGVFAYIDKDSTRLTYLKVNNVEAYGYQQGVCFGSWALGSGFNKVSVTNSVMRDNAKAGILSFAKEYFLHRNVYIGYNKVYNNSGVETDTSGSSTGSGIVLGSVDVAVIEYCKSYNNGWLHKNTKSGGPNGIWAYQSDSVTIQFNESHHNKSSNGKDGGGFDFDGGCTNSIMQYNYAHDNQGAGFLLANFGGARVMKNITIRYNISENNGRKINQGSIHLWASGNSQGIQTVNIYNNTIYLTPSPNVAVKAFYIRSGPMSGIRVRNNIFQTTGGVDLVRVEYNTSSCIMQGNSYWSSGSTFKIIWGSTTYSSLNAWRTATGQEQLNGTATGIQADAQFADTTTGVTFSDAKQITNLKRYKLLSSSELINKGLDLKTLFGINVGTRDFWGNSLANKTVFHMGAFQGTPISSTTTSTTSLEVNFQDQRAGLFSDTPYPARQRENTLQVFSGPGQRDFLINFALIKGGRVSLTLYNMQGQLVKGLLSEEVRAGTQRQLRVETGMLTQGIYLVRMETNGEVLTKKVLLHR